MPGPTTPTTALLGQKKVKNKPQKKLKTRREGVGKASAPLEKGIYFFLVFNYFKTLQCV